MAAKRIQTVKESGKAEARGQGDKYDAKKFFEDPAHITPDIGQAVTQLFE